MRECIIIIIIIMIIIIIIIIMSIIICLSYFSIWKERSIESPFPIKSLIVSLTAQQHDVKDWPIILPNGPAIWFEQSLYL